MGNILFSFILSTSKIQITKVKVSCTVKINNFMLSECKGLDKPPF